MRRILLLLTAIFSLYATAAQAAPVVRMATGSSQTSIQTAADQFRSDLGGALNPNNGQVFDEGRREINWDGVPDQFASPNAFPSDFFNVNSPRGVLFSTPGSGFRVSRTAGAGQVRFSDIEPSYASTFGTFSPQRLFTPLGSTITDIEFVVPRTNDRLGVKGFGAVFTDVDVAGSKIQWFDAAGGLLLERFVPAMSGTASLSFLGASFDGIGPVARVRITSGSKPLAAGVTDGGATDVVAIDDLIYGEPRDGDGTGIADNCPAIPNPDLANTDGDKQGDACDADDDNDGVADADDAFPRDATESADQDGDGIGDNADPDDNGNGIADADEAAGPAAPAAEADADGDGRADSADNCPAIANPDQADGDADGRGDACDAPGLSTLGVKRATKGFKVSYKLSESARVAFTVQKKGSDGRYRRVKGGFSKLGRSGANSFTFSGKLRRKALGPGTYRLAALAIDPANQRSTTVRKGFRVARR